MPIEESVLRRYMGVLRLAVEGAPGERDVARQTLDKMQSKYPGIHLEAQKLVQDKTPARGAPTRRNPLDAIFGGSVNWDEVFRVAQDAYTNIADIASRVVDAERGRAVASDAEAKMKVNRDGDLMVSIKLPHSVVRAARSLSDVQQGTFRTALHELLDAQLDRLFGE